MHSSRARAATAIATMAVAGLSTACGHDAVALPPIPWPSASVGTGAAVTPAAASHGVTSEGVTSGGGVAGPEPDGLDFTVAGRLPPLTGQAVAWRLGPDGSERQLARLASALGVTGGLHVTTSGWSASDSTRSLTIERSGGAFFTFAITGGVAGRCPIGVPISSGGRGAGSGSATRVGVTPSHASATPAVTTAFASAVTTFAICPEEPVAPPPTTARPGTAAPATATPATGAPVTTATGAPVTAAISVVPTEAESIQLVRAVLAHAGLPVSGSPATATMNGTGWTVQLSPSVGGVTIANSPFVAVVGAGPTISYAAGYLATPVEAGDYPLTGTQVALMRLRHGIDVASSPGDAGSSTVSSTAVPPGGTASVTPCPSNAMCAPLPVGLTITGVHLALALVPSDGSLSAAAWLAPAYVFEQSDGSTSTVLAVAGRDVSATPIHADGTGAGVASPARDGAAVAPVSRRD